MGEATWLDWPDGSGWWWVAFPPPSKAEPVVAEVQVQDWDDTDYGAPGKAIRIDWPGTECSDHTSDLVGRGYRWQRVAPCTPPGGPRG